MSWKDPWINISPVKTQYIRISTGALPRCYKIRTVSVKCLPIASNSCHENRSSLAWSFIVLALCARLSVNSWVQALKRGHLLVFVCMFVWVSGQRGWVWQSCQVTEERVAKLLSGALEEQRTACHSFFPFFTRFLSFQPVFFSARVVVRQQF